MKKLLYILFPLLLAIPLPTLAVPGIAQSNATDDFLDEEDVGFEELLVQAQHLMYSGRPIDARAKLQKALGMSPKDYRPHMMLGQYYLFEVAHFKLAYRYLLTAEKLFETQHGNIATGSLAPELFDAHMLLLYLLSESQLNLDKYSDSLATLDRIEAHYPLPIWYPGTRAWVLMKLKRIDEAIQVAQSGLMQGADPRRTWNILGILLSVKENRELSLQAFGEAIKSELGIGGSGHVATPLNNAGEVYRELFQDDLAEGSWLRAIKLPDGCDHVLPSLNLAMLYIDQLRFFQADRSLSDFESCFSQQQVRKDTEHRTLLALARGKIALHSNRFDDALPLLTMAEQDQQWFGKIGTNENDVNFAASVSLSQALNAQAEALRDTERETIKDSLLDTIRIPWLEIRAWWLNRKARKIALEELDDLEDLFIRNTDTMIEYPTLGTVLADFSPMSLSKRIERAKKLDKRIEAHQYYNLYLATNYLAHGKNKEAITLLTEALANFRPIDRLARAEALARLIQATEEEKPWFRKHSLEKQKTLIQYKEQLFSLLPSHLRINSIALPVALQQEATDKSSKKLLSRISSDLLSARFSNDTSLKVRYKLLLSSATGKTDKHRQISIHLVDSTNSSQIASQTAEVGLDGDGRAELINTFIEKALRHRSDPPGQAIRPIPILEGIFKQ